MQRSENATRESDVVSRKSASFLVTFSRRFTCEIFLGHRGPSRVEEATRNSSFVSPQRCVQFLVSPALLFFVHASSRSHALSRGNFKEDGKMMIAAIFTRRKVRSCSQRDLEWSRLWKMESRERSLFAKLFSLRERRAQLRETSPSSFERRILCAASTSLRRKHPRSSEDSCPATFPPSITIPAGIGFIITSFFPKSLVSFCSLSTKSPCPTSRPGFV